MSYGSQYHIIQKNENPTLTWRVELAKKGYGGSSTRLEGDKDAGSFVLEYESLDTDDIFVAQKSRLEMYFVVRNSSDRSILETVFGADDDEYRLRLKLDGTIVWEGAVLTDQLELPADAFGKGAVIAKDISRIEGTDYPLAEGREKIIVTLAGLLGNLGLGHDIKTVPSFTHADINDPGDWLNQIYNDKERIRVPARSEDESDQPIDRMEVLQQLCKSYGLILRQSGGVWYIAQLTGMANDPATEYTYNSSGTGQSSDSVDFDAAVDKVERWLLPEGRTLGSPAVKKVTAEYHHDGRTKTLVLPLRFDVDAGDVQREFEMDAFFTDGNQSLSITFGAEADGLGEETFAYVELQARVGSSGNYYYLANSENGPVWVESTSVYRVNLRGGDNWPENPDFNGNTGDSEILFFRDPRTIDTPTLPADADGTIRLQFRAATAELGEGQADTALDTRYYDVDFTINGGSAEADSNILTYSITQAKDVSGTYEFGETWFGDGPSPVSPSALRWGSGGVNFTDSKWRRALGTAEERYHTVLMREVMDTQRSSVEVKEAELLGDYLPHQVLTEDNGDDRYFFLEGRLTGSDGLWSARLLKLEVDTAGDDDIGTIIDSDDGGGGGGGGSGPGPDNEAAVGELTEAVSDTAATEIPIECYTGKSIETGKDYYVKAYATQRPYYFTATETVDSGTHDLSIQEDVIIASEGSKIYKDEGQRETERIIQVEAQNATETARAALSLSVSTGREAQSIGLTSAEVSGNGVTSVPLQDIPEEISLEDGTTLTIMSLVDTDEGANETITVDGEQT